VLDSRRTRVGSIGSTLNAAKFCCPDPAVAKEGLLKMLDNAGRELLRPKVFVKKEGELGDPDTSGGDSLRLFRTE